jgi:hypothetical protein
MSDIHLFVHTDLGSNHFMESNVTLRAGGHIDASTRTHTGTWFGGFTGGVSVVFYDAGNQAIAQTLQNHAFGVDGTAIGRSDRTDQWSEDIDPAKAALVTHFDILHFWDPKYSAVDNIVHHAVQIGEDAAPLLQSLKSAGLIP